MRVDSKATNSTNYIVHNVIIGDASGSMSGSKYSALMEER